MGLNVIVDLSHHNGNVDLKQASEYGIVGVIHKATQGIGNVDHTYIAHREQAKEANMLWGAYHFGVGGSGTMQADWFLHKSEPDDSTLLVLDLETNKTGSSMTLSQARDFVEHIHEETGRFPGLYSGDRIKSLLGDKLDPILSQCWFWLAQYGDHANVPPCWPTWTMWQYTDGNVGPQPHYVPGIGHCDRDKFNGSMDQLRKLWVKQP
jgi:lysozyme